MLYFRSVNPISHKSGQTMLEYLLVFVALIAVVAALATFTRAAKAASERTTEIACFGP